MLTIKENRNFFGASYMDALREKEQELKEQTQNLRNPEIDITPERKHDIRFRVKKLEEICELEMFIATAIHNIIMNILRHGR